MRPWQLTRRQRVEMEACLARLRMRAYTWPTTDSLADGIDALGGYGWDLLRRYSVEDDRWLRTLRARVAIALRAALRADEDARCEEVLGSVTWRLGLLGSVTWRLGHYHGARYAVDALREWPELSRGWAATVPLALWEGGG